jgi:hypothetical protein
MSRNSRNGNGLGEVSRGIVAKCPGIVAKCPGIVAKTPRIVAKTMASGKLLPE